MYIFCHNFLKMKLNATERQIVATNYQKQKNWNILYKYRSTLSPYYTVLVSFRFHTSFNIKQNRKL